MSMSRSPIRHLATVILVALVGLLLLPAIALGHAELETATPADGSTVTEPVTEVSGSYSSAMLPDGSSLVVEDADGTVVARGGVDPEDDTMMVAIPETPLGDGDYQVKSTTRAIDEDVAHATWHFTVAIAASPSPTASTPASASPSPVASEAPTSVPATPAPTTEPSATPIPSAEGSATGSSSDVLLPIVIALVVLGAGAAYLLNRRNRPSDPA